MNPTTPRKRRPPQSHTQPTQSPIGASADLTDLQKSLLAAVPAVKQTQLASLFRASNAAIANGVVDATHHERQRYWDHWCHFMQSHHLDPHMQTLDSTDQVELLCAFAASVRSGTFGQGRRVRTQTVQVALRAIGAAFELAGKRNPTYNNYSATRTYWKRLSQQLEGYRRQDPPSSGKLAVPVDVAHFLAGRAMATQSDPLARATGLLSNIAFYYLLRVGEYTWSGHKQRRRTQQFRVKDVIFRNGSFIIPNSAPLDELLTATSATLVIDNQKNGIRGQCIHHHCNGLSTSPVKSLAHRVHHIMDNFNNNQSLCISAYRQQDGTVGHVHSSHINAAVKQAAAHLGLPAQGFALSAVSSHSLRAGGAMALKLHGYDRDTIKKMGRWSSDTFLIYIHEQIAAFSTGLSAKMAVPIPFHNIAAPLTFTDAPTSAAA